MTQQKRRIQFSSFTVESCIFCQCNMHACSCLALRFVNTPNIMEFLTFWSLQKRRQRRQKERGILVLILSEKELPRKRWMEWKFTLYKTTIWRFKTYMVLCIPVAFAKIWMVTKYNLLYMLPKGDDSLKQAHIFIFLARPG